MDSDALRYRGGVFPREVSRKVCSVFLDALIDLSGIRPVRLDSASYSVDIVSVDEFSWRGCTDAARREPVRKRDEEVAAGTIRRDDLRGAVQ